MRAILYFLDKILKETEMPEPSWMAIRSYVNEIKRLIEEKKGIH